MNKTAIALLALLASSASLAATPWQKITQPVPGSAQSIGSFSNGCIVGADTLPIQSEHYQVMRTDQRRYFGHPDLVMFIQRLSSQVSNLGMGTVLIGDMGMPAGGRFNGGHASHQTGLDVDIFLQLPALHLAISAVFILISSGAILFETSNIIHGGETNYIRATVSLYVSLYNIFVSLLSILGFASRD